MEKEKTTTPTVREYYAKSANACHGSIPNREHLDKVSRLAKQFGKEADLEAEAELAGLLHDFGKYSDRFQQVLSGQASRVDHAVGGAVYLCQQTKLERKDALKVGGRWDTYAPIIEAIRGHHDGLISLGTMFSNGTLPNLQNGEMTHLPVTEKTPALLTAEEFVNARAGFVHDLPGRMHRPKSRTAPPDPAADMLDTRMLFSCLVDADYTVSAQDDSPQDLSSDAVMDVDEALRRLEAHRAAIRQASTAAASLNCLRDQVYEACGEAAARPMGLFTLTAPTGVGKTLAMLHFALRHCKQHGLRRIIVVLPFLTLAEQTEKTYREIFPDILVDHSQRELTEEQRILAARWDAPVIITTSVRFFESLFSDRPTDCRKLHHIAGSVVLFDEAQSLPAPLAAPTVAVVNRLCERYRCSMVFSTATQPEFSALPGAKWAPTEILPDPARLFREMRRVQVEWRLCINRDRLHKPSLSAIAAELSRETNACCLVNLRAQARELIRELEELRGTSEGLYLLSTDLCPGHRLAVVEEIKRRQTEGLDCLVVATQCIEAGVDLDFDVMYRALAPLEGIIQAAGRCNRNGRLPHGGRVVVFEPEGERIYPDDAYGKAAGVVSHLWAERGDLDIGDPELIRTYYTELFHEMKEEPTLQSALQIRHYEDVKRAYRLISDGGVRLILPWAGDMEHYRAVQSAVDKGSGVTEPLLRAAAPVTITCFNVKAVRDVATEVFLSHRGERVPTGTFILNRGYEDRYHEKWGLELQEDSNTAIC